MVFRSSITLAFVITGALMYAQVQPVGTVDGTVTDSSGAVLAGGKVT